jgi:hypothetical protein
MLDNYQDLIDELLSAPKLLRDAIAAHGGEAPPEVLALIVQLTLRDDVVLRRLNEMRKATSPHVRPLPALDDLPAPEGDIALDAAIAAFDTNRGELVSLLMNLTLKDWERTATQDTGGTTSLADEVEFHVEFDEEVRARIESTLG